MSVNKYLKTWIVNGTYNENLKQIDTIRVSLERRHGNANTGKKKLVYSTSAAMRTNGTWVALLNGHSAPAPGRNNQPKLHVVVQFMDANGIELFRTASAAL